MTDAYHTEADQLVVRRPGERTLAASFERFHQENPQVYRVLVRLARRWKRRYPDRPCGIAMLYEVARWHIGVPTEGEPVMLNNNYRSFFSRLIMEQEPDLEGLFAVRRQRQ